MVLYMCLLMAALTADLKMYIKKGFLVNEPHLLKG